MTSANVTYYKVYRGDEKILEDRQNHLCKNWVDEKLYAIEKPDECRLVTIWPDEYECPHENEYNLGEYLAEKTKRDQEQKDSCRFFCFMRKRGYTLEQIQSMGTLRRAILKQLWKRSKNERERASNGAAKKS